MSKTAQIALVALTLPICAQAQTANPQAKEFKCTYPKVEVVSRQLLNDNGRVVESPGSVTNYQICDEQRREIESGELLNGEPDIKVISRYDKRGNEIEHEFWTHNLLTRKSTSRYDLEGRMTSQDYGDGTTARCRHVGKRSWCRVLNEAGRVQKRWMITRDRKGRDLSRVEFEPGRSANRYVYSYDPRGNRIEESHHYRSDDKNKKSRQLFTFNEKGKLIEKTWHDENGLRSREVYEYNERGDLTRRTEYSTDKIPVEQMTIEYHSYDARGNWSKAVETRIRRHKDKITLDIRRVLYRTITYPKSTIAHLRG